MKQVGYMVREIIKLDEKRRQNDIQLEYDEEKFEIIYIENLRKIVLKRKKDYAVLAIFDDNIGFLIEHDIYGYTHFVISDANDYKEEGILLKHYRMAEEGLYLVDVEHIEDARECTCRIKDHYYIVNQKRYGGAIYNLRFKDEFHDFIHKEKEILEQFEEPVLLVTDVCKWRMLEDKITYGINLDTFDVVTPIYSKLQQRMIPLRTKDWLDEPLSSEKKGPVTIQTDIVYTLQCLDDYLKEPWELYNQDKQVNQEYVRKFTKIK